MESVLGVVFSLGTFTLAAQAQIPLATEAFPRAQKLEVYGIGQYLHSGDAAFSGPQGEVRLKMDDTGLGGFGLAYHFNDFLSLRGDFMFGGVTLRTEGMGGTPFSLARDAFINTGRLNLDYNIINRRLTPFVTAGLGYQFLSAELESHPPITECWWDPWWGYVCYTGKPTYSETDFTWNVGAGVRWNVTDHLFIKAMGGANWLEYSGAKGVTTQIEGIFSIGWNY